MRRSGLCRSSSGSLRMFANTEDSKGRRLTRPPTRTTLYSSQSSSCGVAPWGQNTAVRLNWAWPFCAAFFFFCALTAWPTPMTDGMEVTASSPMVPRTSEAMIEISCTIDVPTAIVVVVGDGLALCSVSSRARVWQMPQSRRRKICGP